jgi:ATP-dependent DNA helicase RecQ
MILIIPDVYILEYIMKDKYHRRLNKVLEEKWGFPELKPKQMEIIEAIVDKKRDVIGLLPTGYGKSMTFLIPPLITRKVCIIISPLISLMEDQKEKLIERDIPVAALHGNNFNKDKEIFQIIDGEIHIVYMSPEFLIHGDGLELATTLNNDKMLGLFAIDEAHCTSVWGHDFRNDYLQMGIFREKFPKVPILAVTATATFPVVEDIVEYLSLKEPLLVRGDFDRPNLFLKFENSDGIDVKVVESYIEKYIISQPKESEDRIIIYTCSRKDTVELSDEINKKWKKISLAYHAGLSKKMRSMIQTKFSTGEVKIIVSTIAFGMGIDQTVRCVMIFGAPSSIEEYYQQIGRAGRDYKPAETILFFQYKRIKIAESGLSKYTNLKVRQAKAAAYRSMSKLFFLKTCRRKFILEYFGQIPKFFNCHNCDNCLKFTKDVTKKVYKYLIEDDDLYDTFKDKDITKLKSMDLITVYDKKVKNSLDFIHWKKIIVTNKINMENMKDKYRIYI